MWGALTLLLAFLVIDPTTRDIILAGLEHARLRLAVEAPLSYFLAVVLAVSALVSALIMACWPKAEPEPRRHQVVRRYFGPADSEPRPAVVSPTPGLDLILAVVRYVFSAHLTRAERKRRLRQAAIRRPL